MNEREERKGTLLVTKKNVMIMLINILYYVFEKIM